MKSPTYYSAVVPINTLGQVLLGKRQEDGIITTPAGGSEEGETPKETAVRELFEESGIATRKEFLQELQTQKTKNGKSCYCYLYVVPAGTMVTSKLDPDQEVKTWQWFSMDQLPDALQKDNNRFTSVRNAYMKYNGITKSLTDKLKHESACPVNSGGTCDCRVSKFEKGGKPAMVGETRLFGGKEFKKMGNGEWVPVVHEEEKQIKQLESKKEISPKQKLANKLDEKTTVTNAEQSLENLKNGAMIEGVETRSGKPVFTKVEIALSHGCKAPDLREIGNMHYDFAEKLSGMIKRLEDSGQKPEPALSEIAKIHAKTGKQFISQAARIDDRNAKVKKSVVSTGHNDAAEINTADYAIEQRTGSKEGYWLDVMQDVMASYQYGDEPQVITLDEGQLYLVKVDDGMYSGIFKKVTHVDDGEMIDNAKVRLERMTLPSLVQFCMAKEWIKRVEVQDPSETAGKNYAAAMDYYGGQLEAMDLQDNTVNDLAAKLEAPMMPVESDLDKRIRILELLSKLTS